MQCKDYTKKPTNGKNKITELSLNRMRTRTAKEQQADALAALKGPSDIPLPDADDSSIRGVMR